ncbi:MAG: hypothetical protein DMG23_15480, partial [Acidobacteria bacterium]
TNLIGNGLLALLRHPDQMRRVWDDASLVPSAVEEILRYDSPVQLTSRLAKVDLEMHGTKISRGQWVYLLLAAANRDPAQFSDPDRFDVGRAENKHIAFGAGPHFCMEAPLARLEAQVCSAKLVLNSTAFQRRGRFVAVISCARVAVATAGPFGPVFLRDLQSVADAGEA